MSMISANELSDTEVTRAKVFITSAYDDKDPITTFREYAVLDKRKVHAVVEIPEAADIILFVENSHFHSDYFFRKLLGHPLVKKYPEKTFMYNPHDVPWAVLRGLYPNFHKRRFDERYIAAAPYFETINKYIGYDVTWTPKYLYSFYGAPSSKVRRRIFRMDHHPGAKIVYSAQHLFFDSAVKPQDPQIMYADLIRDSKFVLAPCGIGTSSIRLFEILQSGRVPVILSDQFVFPEGPDWDKISIVIPEKNVLQIPQILAREEASWPERAAAARKAWENYFAPTTVFHYFVESLVKLKQHDYHMSSSLKVKNLVPFWSYAFRKLVIEKVSPVMKPVVKKVTGLFTADIYNKYRKVA